MEYHVIATYTETPWCLTLGQTLSKAQALQALRWQNSAPGDWAVATWSPEQGAFVEADGAGRVFVVNRGPLTQDAFERHMAALQRG